MRVSNRFAPRLMRRCKTFALFASDLALAIKNGACGGNESTIGRITASFRNCFGTHHILHDGGWVTCGEEAIDDAKGGNAGGKARLVASETSGRV